MLSPELLRETLDTVNYKSESSSIMLPVVRSEKHKKFFDYSTLNAFSMQIFSRYIELLTACTTRVKRVAVDSTAVNINREWS